uniref:Elongation factor G, mitochondrial n=1 Tax=Alexandrium monilatum TaxID=311494 RepID=A0A7S4PW82_9DINO|mmetsp:Transcript_70323/g.219577  ORF Transcript_70323/g.219577 Transcript_70323/m.219577 type:complete len:738 (+) Transcript_70323:50-2263(+)
MVVAMLRIGRACRRTITVFPLSLRVHRSFATAINDIRNFGISAHIDSGKTTLTERILFYTGRIKEIHEVRGKDGVGAKMDHMELEREKGITITSAATYCSWKSQGKDHHLNLIDTPGHVDFTIEVERALRVLDGAVMVCCGVGGVQSQTITVDRQMKRYEVPRIIFVNKLDRYGADPLHVLGQVRKKLGLTSQAIQIPIGEEDNFMGVCDVITRKACLFEGSNGLTQRIVDIPEALQERVAETRAELLEVLADLDDQFAEIYLEHDDVPEDAIHAAIRRQTLARKFCPLMMGSAMKNKGVQNLLDAICRYLPSPMDRRNVALNADNEEEEVTLKTTPDAPLVGYAFKIQDHPQAGQVTYMRIYQGKISKNDQVVNMMNQKRLGVKRLVRMHSEEVKDVPSAVAGDIVALAGVDCDSGVTFTDGKQKVSCSSMFVPDPVMSLSVSAGRDDQARFQKALRRFQREDPTFRVEVKEDTKETIISGMGELHLDIYCERMRREYKVESLETGEPKVNYRETITQKAMYDYTHKRQTGGRGQYGKVIGYFEPIPDEEKADFKEGIDFVSKLSGNEIPPNYVPAIEKGFRSITSKGLLTGNPLIHMRCVLEDGAAHDVDSSSEAFQAAAAGAFENFYNEAGPVVLEPLMLVEVTFPTEFQSQALQTLNQREGSIQSTRAVSGDTSMVEAIVPLRRMFGYSSELRSVTQGQGEFSMEFQEYEHMPSQKQEELVLQSRQQRFQARA